MGTVNCPLRISSMDGQQSVDIEATVDTGAAYTTLPGRVLRELGIEPFTKRRFVLADGRRMDMEIGRAWAAVEPACGSRNNLALKPGSGEMNWTVLAWGVRC